MVTRFTRGATTDSRRLSSVNLFTRWRHRGVEIMQHLPACCISFSTRSEPGEFELWLVLMMMMMMWVLLLYQAILVVRLMVILTSTCSTAPLQSLVLDNRPCVLLPLLCFISRPPAKNILPRWGASVANLPFCLYLNEIFYALSNVLWLETQCFCPVCLSMHPEKMISWKVFDGFSANLHRRCIMRQTWIIKIWVQKVKDQGHVLERAVHWWRYTVWVLDASRWFSTIMHPSPRTDMVLLG